MDMNYSNSLELEDSDSNDKTIMGMAPLKEQERFLPIANIAKIMKKAIPDNGKIAKDARECIQECVSEFISFITSEASERCQSEKRKTMNGEDILFSLCTLGFENYIEPLKVFLQKYRDSTKTEKNPSSEHSGDELSDFVPAANNNGQEPTEANIMYWSAPI